MQKVKILRDFKYALDGIKTTEFKEGTVVSCFSDADVKSLEEADAVDPISDVDAAVAAEDKAKTDAEAKTKAEAEEKAAQELADKIKYFQDTVASLAEGVVAANVEITDAKAAKKAIANARKLQEATAASDKEIDDFIAAVNEQLLEGLTISEEAGAALDALTESSVHVATDAENVLKDLEAAAEKIKSKK